VNNLIKKKLFYVITSTFILVSLVGCSRSKINSEKTIAETNSPASTVQNIQNEQSTTVPVKEAAPVEKTPSETPAVTVNPAKANESQNTSPVKAAESTPKPIATSKPIVVAPANKNNKIIVVDAGHGGKSTSATEPVSPGSSTMKAKNVSGATGNWTKTPESVITLKVAQKLRDNLSSKGYTVIMTRNSASETISNIERAEIGNNNNAALVIRIHADSADGSSAKGASMLVPGEVGYAKDIYKISQTYGKTIFNTLLNEVGMKSRGIVTRTDLTGFNWSKVPVVLIEMGFLSNEEEDRLLATDAYQEKIAKSLSNGIDAALK
jgi:N-acetylmuramoyl-L-alanine amidase